MQPNIEISIVPIILVVITNTILGMLWYSPLMFGKQWAKELNMDLSQKVPATVMIRGIVLSALGSILMTFVMQHDVQVWQPSSWNLTGDKPMYVYGFFAGLFCWLGFQVSLLLNALAWEGISFKFFAINASHQFVSLQIAGMIVAYTTK